MSRLTHRTVVVPWSELGLAPEVAAPTRFEADPSEEPTPAEHERLLADLEEERDARVAADERAEVMRDEHTAQCLDPRCCR